MARSFDVDNPDYIYRAAPVTGAPFTISVWYNSTSVTANRVIAGLYDTASNNNSFLIYHGSDTKPYFFIQDAAWFEQVPAISTSRATGSWWHACAAEAAVNEHNFVNHGTLDYSTVSVTPVSIDRYALGIRADATPDGGYDGLIAEAALWNVALTIAEVLALKVGYPPLLIRPESLVSYLPLIRDNDADLIDGVIWTASGSPGVGAHTRVFYPGTSIYVPFSGVIIGSTCWGHSTGVAEANTRTFAANWTGTGEISGAGDAETICLNADEYMESEVVNTGTLTVELDQNVYAAGDDILLRYRHGASEAACLAAAWNNYTIPFDSAGYVQVRIESTL